MDAISLTPGEIADATPLAIQCQFTGDKNEHGHRVRFDIIGATHGGLIVRAKVTGLWGFATVTGRVTGRDGTMRGIVRLANANGYTDGRITFDGTAIRGRAALTAWAAAQRTRDVAPVCHH